MGQRANHDGCVRDEALRSESAVNTSTGQTLKQILWP